MKKSISLAFLIFTGIGCSADLHSDTQQEAAAITVDDCRFAPTVKAALTGASVSSDMPVAISGCASFLTGQHPSQAVANFQAEGNGQTYLFTTQTSPLGDCGASQGHTWCSTSFGVFRTLPSAVGTDGQLQPATYHVTGTYADTYFDLGQVVVSPAASAGSLRRASVCTYVTGEGQCVDSIVDVPGTAEVTLPQASYDVQRGGYRYGYLVRLDNVTGGLTATVKTTAPDGAPLAEPGVLEPASIYHPVQEGQGTFYAWYNVVGVAPGNTSITTVTVSGVSGEVIETYQLTVHAPAL